ncbi:cation:proton antiporter [Nocardioides sp.]|uniref:cation:proton antiporter n=1 Tax=Nocardioides sp. TaxID=35761 RepID=UPI002B2783CB|nr:monovalent cation/H(+) antiporter subunit G [Nocardioides sp.]
MSGQSGSDVLEVVGGVLLVLGSLFFLVTAVGMLRSGDAISRVNNLSPAMGAGMPLIIVGAALDVAARGELSVTDGVLAALAIGAALVVSSVASNLLGRAAYRTQRVLDPRTISNALGPHEDLPEPTWADHPDTAPAPESQD